MILPLIRELLYPLLREKAHHTVTGRTIAKETKYTMKTLRTALFTTTFLFAIGAFAWQYPSGGQAQPQQGTMPQTQQPSQTQPPQSLPSQNQGAMQPGQQQQQPGTTSQSQGMAGHPPSIDDQVRVLSDQLNLSADQQTKVKNALEDQHSQAMTVVQDNSLAREDKIQKIHALRQATIDKVRTSLNDDQKKKFDLMVQQQPGQSQHESQQTPPQPKQ